MSMHSAHIVLIDDDDVLTELLSTFLENDGFIVTILNSGQHALTHLLAEKQPADVIVLDIMMPDISGLEVLQQLRREIQTPIIMLTGRGDEIDRIVGLEMGADDYLGKPCNPRELSARIKAILRRTQSTADTISNIQKTIHTTRADGTTASFVLTVCPGTLEARIDDKRLQLTSAEFHVLHLLLSHAGTLIDKAKLTKEVLGRTLSRYDRSIDVHVSRVRKKLNDVSPLGNHIKSIRSRGYQLLLNGHETD